jgi:predicted DNA-binding transcriptional regulator AlpA
MKGDGSKELLTVKDVVEMTNGLISAATLRWYRATGQGGSRSGKLGRRVVYRRSDVEAWIAAAFEDANAVTLDVVVDAAPSLLTAQRDRLAALSDDGPDRRETTRPPRAGGPS